jgi:Coenzyme PQQ synthesis protein D (PqqD)
MKSAAPRAREESLIIKTLPDEVLVYDLNEDKAHCLNRTAAFVWNNCDGRKTVSEIARLLREELQAPVDENVVWLALDQLEKFQLLQERATKPGNVNGMSRRQLVRSLGLVAISLPLITSIVAPTPAQAATLLPPGSCCNSPIDCSSGSCVQGGPCSANPNTKSCA